jgi:hypothetical protein
MMTQIIAVPTAVRAKIVTGRKTSWRIVFSPDIKRHFQCGLSAGRVPHYRRLPWAKRFNCPKNV